MDRVHPLQFDLPLVELPEENDPPEGNGQAIASPLLVDPQMHSMGFLQEHLRPGELESFVHVAADTEERRTGKNRRIRRRGAAADVFGEYSVATLQECGGQGGLDKVTRRREQQRRALDIDRRGVHGKISSLQEAQASRDAPQPLLSDQRVATRWNRHRGVDCVDQVSPHGIDPEAEPPILDVQASVKRLPADRRPFHERLVGWLLLAPVALDHHQRGPGAAAQQTERQRRPDLVSEAGPCASRLVLVHALLPHPSHSPGVGPACPQDAPPANSSKNASIGGMTTSRLYRSRTVSSAALPRSRYPAGSVSTWTAAAARPSTSKKSRRMPFCPSRITSFTGAVSEPRIVHPHAIACSRDQLSTKGTVR